MSNENKKLTLAVIFGGVSSEHDISCISAKGIISNIDYNKYNVILLGITKDGRWYIFNDDISLLPNGPNLKVLFRLTYHLILQSAV